MPPKKTPATREARRTLFQDMIADLRNERDELLARVSAIETELGEYGALAAAAPVARRAPVRRKKAAGAAKSKANVEAKRTARTPRPPREGSLKAHIIAALGKKPISPAGITAAVIAAGYHSTSKQLGQRVAVACSEMVRAGQIGKQGRGRYVSA